MGELYRRLLRLKRHHAAPANGAWGARMVPLRGTAPEHVLSFVRDDGPGAVLLVLNLSDRAVDVALGGSGLLPVVDERDTTGTPSMVIMHG